MKDNVQLYRVDTRIPPRCHETEECTGNAVYIAHSTVDGVTTIKNYCMSSFNYLICQLNMWKVSYTIHRIPKYKEVWWFANVKKECIVEE